MYVHHEGHEDNEEQYLQVLHALHGKEKISLNSMLPVML